MMFRIAIVQCKFKEILCISWNHQFYNEWMIKSRVKYLLLAAFKCITFAIEYTAHTILFSQSVRKENVWNGNIKHCAYYVICFDLRYFIFGFSFSDLRCREWNITIAAKKKAKRIYWIKCASISSMDKDIM